MSWAGNTGVARTVEVVTTPTIERTTQWSFEVMAGRGLAYKHMYTIYNYTSISPWGVRIGDLLRLDLFLSYTI
jgi:hypothetical protein